MHTYSELLRIRPGEFGKALNSNPATVMAVVEATSVDDIGSFLAALGDDVIGAEAVGGGFEVGE